jgi:RNA recognition motif-containing protein
MLPKSVSEGELHDMFSPYGLLKEVVTPALFSPCSSHNLLLEQIHIIRGPEGHSKGCAFVKFIDRDAANAAIDELNDTIPEVCLYRLRAVLISCTP